MYSRVLAWLIISVGVAAAQTDSPATPVSDIFNTDLAFSPQAASSATNSYVIAHFPFRQGWSTRVLLANSGTSAASVTITFFDQSGHSTSVPLDGLGMQSSQTVTIQPKQVHVLGVDPSQRNSGSIQVAWATASSNVPLNVFSLFDFGPNAPAISGAVGAQSDTPAKTFRFPISVNGPLGFKAGMALANPNGSPTSVTVKVLNADGSTKGSFVENLPANGQEIFVLGDPGGKLAFDTSLFNGSIAVCATQPIGLVTVGFEGSQAFFSTAVTNDPCP